MGSIVSQDRPRVNNYLIIVRISLVNSGTNRQAIRAYIEARKAEGVRVSKTPSKSTTYMGISIAVAEGVTMDPLYKHTGTV